MRNKPDCLRTVYMYVRQWHLDKSVGLFVFNYKNSNNDDDDDDDID